MTSICSCEVSSVGLSGTLRQLRWLAKVVISSPTAPSVQTGEVVRHELTLMAALEGIVSIRKDDEVVSV